MEVGKEPSRPVSLPSACLQVGEGRELVTAPEGRACVPSLELAQGMPLRAPARAGRTREVAICGLPEFAVLPECMIPWLSHSF